MLICDISFKNAFKELKLPEKKITHIFLESLSSRKAKNRDRQVEGGTEEALRLP